MKNYLLVIDQIKSGGAERILVDYCCYLQKKGCLVSIFVLHGHSGQSVWTKGLKLTYGINQNQNHIVLKLFQHIVIFFKLMKVVKKENPDVIFSFLEKSNLLTTLIPVRAKKVLSVHNLLSLQYTKIKSNFTRKILYIILKFVYNSNKNTIAVSEQVKSDLVHSFHVNSKNIKVINNRVDPKDIQLKSIENIDNFTFEPKINYILNVGRYSNQKAQWKLIKAFSLFNKEMGDNKTHLIIMGEGENKADLEELTKCLMLTDKITFLPFNANPYKYMAKAKLFVLSSIFEGFPIVIAEISSLRIPFIGTNTSIPIEMFSDKQIWEMSVFKNNSINYDINPTINEDEIELSKLIFKGMENDEFRQSLLDSTVLWEKNNNKLIQFQEYDDAAN